MDNKHKLRIGSLPTPAEIIPTTFTDIAITASSMFTGGAVAGMFGAPTSYALLTGMALAVSVAIGRRIETAQERRGCIAKEGGIPIIEAWEGNPTPTKTPLTNALADYGLPGATSAGTRSGAVVEREYIKLPKGTKSSGIPPVLPDIARDIGAKSIIFNRNIGGGLAAFDVPLKKRRFIHLADIFKTPEWERAKREMALPIAIGEHVDGTPLIQDLSQLIHLLIAGKTGGGKSGLENCIIISLLQSRTPQDVKLLMIDPKQVELTAYENSAYLLRPVITNMDEAEHALSELVEEMERRYTRFRQAGVKQISGYRAAGHQDIPYIVNITDEFGDMMMTHGKQIESHYVRLGQKSRAAGIITVPITQRPSVDVITGLIKAQCATRIGLTMASGADSKTIIDTVGCEDLLGKGDMLFSSDATGIIRAHGAFVPDNEIAQWVK
ncbi:FtsK/SpoIIIE domain-containing protein [Candidatus Thiothrix sp. Deng01]|uniref:FtsK/SpoIIIE domain-containing protein n=1 Tax=Candidatus Thiothrix phosphatis TaxID=3112415 RepID=A0ABU6D175_9GAMM|nr:FtsK/SpoIIIE domain-containing protein [Candidatus Thiothrix sp. Deng01]MEB4592824.1 FtsK/SpoIIIE domain-containing protein [Candidatus Thiothrix sp. Deng01]